MVNIDLTDRFYRNVQILKLTYLYSIELTAPTTVGGVVRAVHDRLFFLATAGSDESIVSGLILGAWTSDHCQIF